MLGTLWTVSGSAFLGFLFTKQEMWLRKVWYRLIIITMYIGRIGPLTMALLFMKREKHTRELIHYPEDRVMLG